MSPLEVGERGRENYLTVYLTVMAPDLASLRIFFWTFLDRFFASFFALYLRRMPVTFLVEAIIDTYLFRPFVGPFC